MSERDFIIIKINIQKMFHFFNIKIVHLHFYTNNYVGKLKTRVLSSSVSVTEQRSLHTYKK